MLRKTVYSKGNLDLQAAARHLRVAARILRRFRLDHPASCGCIFCQRIEAEMRADLAGVEWQSLRGADAITVSLSPKQLDEMVRQHVEGGPHFAIDTPSIVEGKS